MSDELIKSLNEQLVKANNQDYNRRKRLKDAEAALETALKQLDTFKAENATLKSQASTPATLSDLEQENQRLKGEIATRDHKTAFHDVAKGLGVKPEALEASWKLADWKVDGVANPDAMKTHLSKVLESNPFLKGEQAIEDVKVLTPGPGLSKGSSNGHQRVVSMANISDPVWMRDNQAWLTKAVQAKEVSYVP